MSNPCGDPLTCPDGNCVGCKNGEVWCQDPRCAPYCAGNQCVFTAAHDFNGNMVVFTILICLLAMLFIIWFVYGPHLFEHHADVTRAHGNTAYQSTTK